MPCDQAVQPVLAVERFTLQRGGGFTAALPELQLRPGEVAALSGPSGSGKSSLLHALFGLAAAGAVQRAGRVTLFGRDAELWPAAARRQLLKTRVAWIMQDAAAALDPLLAVGRQLEQATGCTAKAGVQVLAELGVAEAHGLWRRRPHELSGGQAQRLLVAVALLRRPELLVADEPSASLDDANVEALIARLRALADRGAALLLATHDQRLLAALAARVLIAREGVFAAGAAAPQPWPARAPAPSAGGEPLLLARDLCVQRGGRTVLDGVGLALGRGEVLALVGASGAGKTTLARVLAGLLPPDRGQVQRPARPHAVQLLFQDALGSLTPGRSLRSLLREASAPGFDGDRAAAALALAPALLDRPPAELSGGERRRAALLRALAVEPAVLILDEPTAALDRPAAVAVVETLLAIARQRTAGLLLITHDRELARAVADRVLTLRDGRLWS